MSLFVEIVIGSVGALILILAARRTGKNKERFIYAAGLAFAALIYLLFALFNNGMDHLKLEAIGFVIFTILAAVGLKSAPILGISWAAHSVWDFGLHSGTDTPFVPNWYPGMCAGFDLFLAGYILITAFRPTVEKN